jgi:hypothetical protein
LRSGFSYIVPSFGNGYLSAHQDGYGFAVHFVHHFLEEVVRFELIDQQRVFLFVTCILHRTAEFVHFAQVFLPVVVNGVKQD